MNNLFEIFGPTFEFIVKIYMATEASISINIRNFTNVKITDSVKETLIIRKMAIMPQEQPEAIVPNPEFSIT